MSSCDLSDDHSDNSDTDLLAEIQALSEACSYLDQAAIPSSYMESLPADLSSSDNHTCDEPVVNSDSEGISPCTNILNSTSVANVEDSSKQTSELPKAALAFMDAIRKNRLAQRHIKIQMESVDAKMVKLKEVMKRVKIIWEFDVQERKKMSRVLEHEDRVQLISVPNMDKKLAPAMKHGPEENNGVANYRIAFQKYPQWIAKEKWTREEKANLCKGIMHQFRKLNVIVSQVDPRTIISFLPNVDWDDLACNYLPKRSGQECKARWINFEDPLVNKEEWTKAEDMALLRNLKRLGNNWIALAESLGTKRTAYQCLTRYQRSLNPTLIKREWTRDEDEQLTNAVATHGESSWTIVAAAMEGRTAAQCSNRWMKALLPSKQKKGRWDEDEDKRLKIAVMIVGTQSWNLIAEFVPGRTQARCRDRWVNSLNPCLNFGKWTAAEDAALQEAVGVHGCSWSKVATFVPPRTDNQCRRRWRSLFPDEFRRVRDKKKVARAALPCNFVDRERNRPNLAADDVVPLLAFGYNSHITPKKARSKKEV